MMLFCSQFYFEMFILYVVFIYSPHIMRIIGGCSVGTCCRHSTHFLRCGIFCVYAVCAWNKKRSILYCYGKKEMCR